MNGTSKLEHRSLEEGKGGGGLIKEEPQPQNISNCLGHTDDTIRTFMYDPDLWRRPSDQKKTLPDQWKLRQSKWRFFKALVPYLGPPMNTMKNIFWPLFLILGLCAAIKLLEGRIVWELDQYNNYAALFRYSSFVLSLLLAFRANRTYDRWWQARTSFGSIGSGVGALVRQVACWTDDEALLREYQKWGMCMVYAMVQLINNTPKQTDPRVKQVLNAEELALYESTTKPGRLCGMMLSALTTRAGKELGIDRELALHQMIGSIGMSCGNVARIKLQAMPFAMSLFCTGYTLIWLILLPFGVFPEASWSALLPVFAMATMMLGLEDVTNQMEDPYAFIPYEAMVATTAKDMPRTLREVRACKAAVDAKADALFGKGKDAAAAALPPWPVLLPRKQYYAS